jgi:hypothetical protein
LASRMVVCCDWTGRPAARTRTRANMMVRIVVCSQYGRGGGVLVVTVEATRFFDLQVSAMRRSGGRESGLQDRNSNRVGLIFPSS